MLHGVIPNVRYDDVMNWLVVVCRIQPKRRSDLTLTEELPALCGLMLYVVTVKLPKAFTPRFNSHDKEVDWDIIFISVKSGI